MPYVYTAAVEASETGISVMRPMVMEFPDERTCDYLDRQYMFGDSLLVAPVFEKEGSVSYYLPDGEWTNIISNKKYIGGKWIEEKHDYMSIPLLARENSIIPFGENKKVPDYDYSNNIEFHLFEIRDNADICKVFCDNNGEKVIKIMVKKEDSKVKVEVDSINDKWKVILRGIHNVNEVLNGGYKSINEGIEILPENKSKDIQINL